MAEIPAIIYRHFQDGSTPQSIVGHKLKRIRCTKSVVRVQFKSGGEFTRRLVGAFFRPASKTWWDSLKGQKCIAVVEYAEGMVLDFGLHGLFIKNDGGIEVVERRIDKVQ